MKLSSFFESHASLIASIRISKEVLDAVTFADILAIVSDEDHLDSFFQLTENHDFLVNVLFNEQATKPGSGFIFDIYAVPLTDVANDMLGEHGMHFQVQTWFNYRKLKFESSELNNRAMSETEARTSFPDHKF